MSSTVISTLPFQLYEAKPGLIPSLYVIPPAPKDSISTLVVDNGYHLVTIPLTSERTPPMRVTDTSEQIAKSLIDDFINSCLAVELTPNDEGSFAAPGLFWINRDLSKEVIIKEFSGRINKAKANTTLWFMRLVSLADDDWQKHHQHKMITDLQRHACKYLGLDREWNFDVLRMQSSLCWACKANVNPQAMMCSNCRAILNEKAYTENKARFVPA